MKVNCETKTVHFEDGSTLQYTKLFAATGGLPRLLNVPGADLEGVLYLRSPDDANKIGIFNNALFWDLIIFNFLKINSNYSMFSSSLLSILKDKK